MPAQAQRQLPRPSQVSFIDLPDAKSEERVRTVMEGMTDPGCSGPPWRVSVLAGGATNLNYLVTCADRQYVLRVSDFEAERMGGTRAEGWEVQSAAAAGRIGAPVVAYCAPEGHCLAEFIPGEALSPKTLRERTLGRSAAALLRRLHDLPEIKVEWSAFRDIRHYRAIADREDLELPPDCDELIEAVDQVERVLEGVEGARGFCHNDLQIQNFVDDGQRLWLLDWEWAGMGNRYFDLGGFLINAEATRGEAEQFVQAYFDSKVDVEVELARCELMRLVSAVREATWAVAADPILENEWDYRAWANDYFDRGRRIANSAEFGNLLARAATRH